MNKNILEFCLSPALGGLELCVLDSFKYFLKESAKHKKTQTNCYLCVAPDKKLDNYLQDENKITIKRNKFFPIIPAQKLAKFIDKNEIDVVHFHWTRDIATVVLAKIISKRKPKIVQSRHMAMTRFKDDFYHKWLYKNIDMIHAVTNQVKEQLEKYIPQEIRPNIQMVYLGVNEPIVDEKKVALLKEKYALKDEFVVGIIGRIEEAKGQHLVIEAIARLKDLNIKALIVGLAMNESYLESLKQKVKELKIEEKIIFTGFTKEVNEHIKLCDTTVLATPKETFGLVVIESMINKVPVIAVNNGGPLEIIDNGENGLLFERNSNELSKKINLLNNDTVLRDKIALAGYEKVKKIFNKDTQMQELYKKIVGV